MRDAVDELRRHLIEAHRLDDAEWWPPIAVLYAHRLDHDLLRQPHEVPA